MQSVLADYELAFGIKHDEVGIVAGSESAFACLAAGKICGGARHPARDIVQRKSAFAGFGVRHGQSDGEAPEAAPGGAEISFGEALHFGRAGRVIGCDEVDSSVAEALP